VVEPPKRSLPLLWRLAREAGSPEELARWARNYPAPTSGAPRNATLDAFLDMIEEYHGPHWIMRTRTGRVIKTRHAILRYYVGELVRDHTAKNRDKALPPDAREAWDPKHLGRSSRSARRRSDHDITKRQIDSITRRLIARLRERAKARKTTPV
jgi:hypothetical protein